jgi:hypothetical protein
MKTSETRKLAAAIVAKKKKDNNNKEFSILAMLVQQDTEVIAHLL